MAECHPVGFQWVVEAKARGAKVIHVDPRFTRTSALADLHVPIRAGSDIAFLGGIVGANASGPRRQRLRRQRLQAGRRGVLAGQVLGVGGDRGRPGRGPGGGGRVVQLGGGRCAVSVVATNYEHPDIG